MAHQLDKKFLKDNSVDGTKIKLLKDQALRGQKQNGDEVELLKLNLADKILLDGKEVSYKSELDAEIAARISADSIETAARIAGDEAVDLKIEQEKSRAMIAEGEIEDALQSEISRAIEEETILAQDIASETTRAILAEQQLSLRVDQNAEAIEIERLRAMAEELRINGRVDSQKTYVDATFIAKSEKGQPNGVVPLNAQSKIESAFLPSYIDDVVEYESLSVFPVGEQGKIYVAIDTSKVYRWSGSMFIEISPSEVVSVNGKSGVVTLLASDILTSESITIEAKLTELDSEISAEALLARSEEFRIEGRVDAETSRAIAEESRLDSMIQTKADQASVDQLYMQIQTKADSAFVEQIYTTLQNKADSAYVNQLYDQVQQKADINYVNFRVQEETNARIFADQEEYTRATSEEARIEGKVDSQRIYIDETFIAKTEIGQPNGITPLDENGLVPAQHLPSYVDDVVEYESLLAFPLVGEQSKIYVALDTNKTYRWSGSTYVYITSGAVDTVFGRTGIITAQAGDYSAEQISYGLGSNVQAKLNSLQSEVDAEELRALASEAALSLEIESIGSKFKKESFTIAQSHITAGFITLQFKAFENSTVVSVERLMLLEDVDYTVSVVGGVTRLTFIGSILQGQAEALSINDLIRVQYFKDLRA